MSSNTQSPLDGARERINELSARAKQAEATVRAELVDAYHAEEAEWDFFYAAMNRDLNEIAADIERAEAETIDDIDADIEVAARDLDHALDAIDERLVQMDKAVMRKEDEAAEKVNASFAALRKLRDETFGVQSDTGSTQ